MKTVKVMYWSIISQDGARDKAECHIEPPQGYRFPTQGGQTFTFDEHFVTSGATFRSSYRGMPTDEFRAGVERNARYFAEDCRLRNGIGALAFGDNRAKVAQLVGVKRAEYALCELMLGMHDVAEAYTISSDGIRFNIARAKSNYGYDYIESMVEKFFRDGYRVNVEFERKTIKTKPPVRKPLQQFLQTAAR